MTKRPHLVEQQPKAPGRRRLMKQALGGSLVLMLGPKELAWGAQLLAVRVWPAADYTRVTLELDRPLKFSQNLLPDPPRLFIDERNTADFDLARSR